MYKEEKRASKLCPIVDMQFPESCTLACKFGYRVMSDEQAMELSKKQQNVITHKCLAREVLINALNFFQKQNNKEDDFVVEKKGKK